MRQQPRRKSDSRKNDKYLNVHGIGDSQQLCLARRNHATLSILSGIQRCLYLKSRRTLDSKMSSDNNAFAVYIRIDSVGTFILDTYRYFTSAAIKTVEQLRCNRAEKTM